MKETT